MPTRIELHEVTTEGKSLDDLVKAFNQYVDQDFVKQVIESATNPQYQKSVIVDTILFQQQRQHLKGNEKLPYTRGEAYLTLGIPKEFL